MSNQMVSQHQSIRKIALPMFLVGISTPLLGMVDTAVVGHLSDVWFLGAIAIGAMIFNFIFWAMGFLRMGTTALTTRAIGEANLDDVVLVLLRGLLLAFLCGILLIISQQLIERLVFLFVNSSDEVVFYAKEYFEIRIWAAPATLATYVLLGWFLGQSKPSYNLILVVVINLLNIALDLLFVIVFELTSAGVAWATLIAEYVGLILGLSLMMRKFRLSVTQNHLKQVVNVKQLKEYLTLNFNVFLRTIFLLLSFAIFTLQGARYGELILAANVILMNLQTLMAYGLDSLAHAAEVLVGKNMFSGQSGKMREIVWLTGIWSFAIAILFSVIFGLFGQQLIAILTDIPDVRRVANEYLVWLIISPLISFWSYWLDGVFIGANYSKQMRNTMLISLIFFLIAWQMFESFGNHGLWAALMVFMIVRAISMIVVAYHPILKKVN